MLHNGWLEGLSNALTVHTTRVDRSLGALLDLEDFVLSDTILVRSDWNVALLNRIWWSHKTNGVGEAAVVDDHRTWLERDSGRSTERDAGKHYE